MRPGPSTLRLCSFLALTLATVACSDLGTGPDLAVAGRARGNLSGDLSTVQTAQLVVCPTQDVASARAIIGPEGGSVGARGSTMSIPAGAVPEPTLFEVITPVSRFMELEIHAVGQSAYRFARPVSITINFSRCPGDSIPATAILKGAYIDTVTDQVLELMGGAVDKNGRKLTFFTDHLSGYAVAY
jgi:hypothetical protein